MKQKGIYSAEAPAPVGTYSQAVEHGGLWFISGQLPVNPLSGDIVDGDIEKQTKQVMDNIGAILRSGGYSFSNIIKTTIFLTDLQYFTRVNQIYAGYFSGELYPARSCIEVSGLPKGAMIEIEVIARVD